MGIAVGDAARAATPVVATGALCALVLGHLLPTSRPGRPGARRHGLPVTLLLGTMATCGVHLGARAARERDASCAASLRGGETVVARGVIVEESGRDVRRRLTLRPARLRAGARHCDVRVVVVRFSGRNAAFTPLVAGTHVSVPGTWIRLGRNATRGRRASVRGFLRAGAPPVATDRTPVTGMPSLRIRAVASRRLRRRVSPDVSPLARALLLAERDELAPDTRRRFAEAGLAHLLAVSGLHVGLMAGLVVVLLGSVAPARLRQPAAAVLVGGYVVVIGAPASAVRAALVLGGYAWARSRGWPARAGELLGLAALLALVVRPDLLFDAGFQLSFAGAAGALLGVGATRRAGARIRRTRPGRPTSGIWRRARRGAGTFAIGMGAGSGAFLCTAPVAAAHFGRIAPAALLTHLAGVPLTALSLAALVPTVLLPGGMGALAGDAATGVLRLLDALAGLAAAAPGGHAVRPAPLAAGWAAWLLAVAGLGLYASGAPAARSWPLLAASGALVLVAAPVQRLLAGPHGLVCSLDVGQGDAAIIRSRSGHWLVVDAGPRVGNRDAGRDIVVPELRRLGARMVDVAALTHPDLDHLGGFGALLDAFEVRAVMDSGDPLPSDAYADFLARLDEEGARWLGARAGARLALDGIHVTVLSPPPVPFSERGSEGEANATSLALRITFPGGFVYLTTGDASRAEEEWMLARWPADSLRADLFKVGHHGSRTSTSARWLAAVRPRIAVVSAGVGNRYGHPHREVLERLASAGVERVWRTDRDGGFCVRIRRDGAWRLPDDGAWRSPYFAAAADDAGWHGP